MLTRRKGNGDVRHVASASCPKSLIAVCRWEQHRLVVLFCFLLFISVNNSFVPPFVHGSHSCTFRDVKAAGRSDICKAGSHTGQCCWSNFDWIELFFHSNQFAYFNLINLNKGNDTIKAPQINSNIKCSRFSQKGVFVALLFDRTFWRRHSGLALISIIHRKSWDGNKGRCRNVLWYAASMQWESMFQCVSALHSLNKSLKITAASCVGFTLRLSSLMH